MAKSRNNLLGVGGQRRKLSRQGQEGVGPAGLSDRRAADDRKTELLNRMRARTQGAEGPEDAAADRSAPETPGQDG
ncbi:DUF6243 family protein [Streptomyces sp. NPDC094448]|uniref:DUF6243 family protein n=1 Tax=Streptomyces sp. NPDC094448 TaxID=3366063 RepID=UPI0037F99B15